MRFYYSAGQFVWRECKKMLLKYQKLGNLYDATVKKSSETIEKNFKNPNFYTLYI